jgi:hypothetical protein
MDCRLKTSKFNVPVLGSEDLPNKSLTQREIAMKKSTLKINLISSLCLSAFAFANTASAHDQAGALTNGIASGTGSGATDIYQVICFPDPQAASQNPTDHLFVQIRDDSAAGGQVSAVATIQNRAVSVTDTASGGAASASKALKVIPAAQNATFTVFVHHTAAATDSYLLTTHCEDAANVHTGTQDPFPVLQNQ